MKIISPVVLRTKDQQFVKLAEIAPYAVPPDIVSWGTRTFKANGVAALKADGPVYPAYDEVFHVVIPVEPEPSDASGR